MLSKCANPGCPTSFRYLHEGKLFRIHVDPFAIEPGVTSGIGADRREPVRRVEFFWLCQKCSATVTLSFEKGVGVTIKPVTAVHAMAS